MTGDWDLAEECAQDAFAMALRSWPQQGVPRRPGAWLTTVARNRAIDRLRRAATGTAKLEEVAMSSDREHSVGPALRAGMAATAPTLTRAASRTTACG